LLVLKRAPSAGLPHEGGRRDWGDPKEFTADLLMCPDLPYVVPKKTHVSLGALCGSKKPATSLEDDGHFLEKS